MPGAVPTVHLRPLLVDDAQVFAEWGEDPEFCRAADWSTDVSGEDRLQFFVQLIDSPPADLIRLAAVHDGTVVGYADLRGTSPSERELGFVVGDRRTWRRGLGHAIAHAGCRHGFDVLGLRRVWAETQATNVAAIRILTGVGMQQTSARVLTRFEITVDAWQG